MLLKKFGCEDIMTNYAIAVLPPFGSVTFRFVTNIYRSPKNGELIVRLSDYLDNAVILNNADAARVLMYDAQQAYPHLEFILWYLDD